MRKILSLILLLIVLTACQSTKYVTHRTVEKMNETSLKASYHSKFVNLSGRTVIKLKKEDKDGSFSYQVSLEKGNIEAFYVDNSLEKSLFSITDKDEISSESSGYLKKNQRYYLVIDCSIDSTGEILIKWE